MKLTRREFTALVPGALAGFALPELGVAAVADGSAGTFTTLTLAEASAKLRSGGVTSVQLTEACLARIATYDSKLDAFITVMKEQALAQAHTLDAELKSRKSRGPLHGIPIALKDNIDTADARTTAGSAVFEDRVPAQDAPVCCTPAAGAVIIGKTNLQEFAMGAGETSTSVRREILGRSRTIRAAPPPVPAQRLPPSYAWALGHGLRDRLIRLRSAASSGSNPLTGSCRFAASYRSRSPSTTADR